MNEKIKYEHISKLYDLFVDIKEDIPFFINESKNMSGEVLELMCGTGRISIPLIKSGIKLTCVDYSKELLGIFKKKLKELNLTATIYNQDIRSLNINKKYGFIFKLRNFNS